MAFMIPSYYHGKFAIVSDASGEFEASFPAEFYSAKDHSEDHTVEYEEGWFCQLSAPGYMDQTDWSGPFATEEEAREEIRNTWEVDPDTGDDLDDDGIVNPVLDDDYDSDME
jgi:hypothetical protein